MYTEAATQFREWGRTFSVTHAVRHTAEVDYEEGRMEAAGALYVHVLPVYRAHKEVGSLELPTTVRNLAQVKEVLGVNSEALQLWAEASDLYQTVGVQARVEESTRGFAKLGQEG